MYGETVHYHPAMGRMLIVAMAANPGFRELSIARLRRHRFLADSHASRPASHAAALQLIPLGFLQNQRYSTKV